MALILVLLPAPSCRERLRQALRMDLAAHVAHDTVFVGGWSALHEAAGERPPGLVVFDPYTEGGDGIALCEEFHARFPSAGLLPYGDFGGGRVRDLLRLAQAGVREAVAAGLDDGPSALRDCVHRALADGAVRVVMQALEGVVPRSMAPLVRHLLLHAGQPLCPDTAARLLFCHPKTLRARLRAAGLPSLNRLIVWMRLFRAAHLLDDRARSVESVALAMDFPSAAALRVQMQRYAGVGPQELRAAGGLEHLLGVFRDHAERDHAPRSSTLEIAKQVVRESLFRVQESAERAAAV